MMSNKTINNANIIKNSMPNLVEQSVVLPQKQNNKPERKPQKITQLICLDQNTELKGVFITWMSQCFKYFPNMLSAIYPQIELIINFIQYRFTISQGHPQVGDYLQNLTYKNLTKKIKILYLLLDIVLPYLKKRLTIYIQSKNIQQNQQPQHNLRDQNELQIPKISKVNKILKSISKFLRFYDKIYALANFLNLSIFIYNGQYRNIIQRLLKMQMKFVNPQSSRVLNFTLMNRTMIWQIYQMVLKNVLPYLHQFLGSSLKNIFYLHSYMGVADQQNTQNCVVCGQTPTMATESVQCGHIYCFYCTKSLTGEVKQCKKCGKHIAQWKTLYQST